MVLFVEEDQKYFLNFSTPEIDVDGQSPFVPLGEMIPLGVFSTEALDVPDMEAGASAKKVCIIDTGYSYDHEDLPKRGVSGSASGEADWAVDGNGHGTHVAGIIAALEGNGKGVVGVTRSGNLNFYIVKVFDDFGGWIWSSGLMDAVDKCADTGANVINFIV